MECKVCGTCVCARHCTVRLDFYTVLFLLCAAPLTAALSRRFDSGFGAPSGQILPPPFPPPSLHGEPCRGAPRRQVPSFIRTPSRSLTLCCCVAKPAVIWFQVLSGLSRGAERQKCKWSSGGTKIRALVFPSVMISSYDVLCLLF